MAPVSRATHASPPPPSSPERFPCTDLATVCAWRCVRCRASSKTSRGPVEAAATARRDHRVLREFLARVAMCVACVAPWLLFGQGSLSHLPSATKTIITWTLLMNAGFGYVSTAIGHRAHPFKGAPGCV